MLSPHILVDHDVIAKLRSIAVTIITVSYKLLSFAVSTQGNIIGKYSNVRRISC